MTEAQDIKHCLQVLEKGGVILYPTDTIWGLGCDATNADAIHKIFDIKNRPAHKSVILLLAEVKDILHYVAAPPPQIDELVASFHSPTTFIFEHGLSVADNALNPEDGSIAIRVTTDPFCKSLIKRMRAPLVSTSANLSGEAAPTHFKEVSTQIINAVDYTVWYRRTDNSPATPSAIFKVDGMGELTKIR